MPAPARSPWKFETPGRMWTPSSSPSAAAASPAALRALPRPPTPRSASSVTWDYIRDLVDEIVTVSEDDLAEGLRSLVAEDHLIAEGAGIAAVAAVAARRVTLDGSRAAIVVSGANIDNSTLVEILTNAD